MRFGVFELDSVTGELTKNRHRLRLQEQPRKILQALIDRPGALVSRDELVREIWPDGIFVDYEHGLNAAVARLRQILHDSAESPRYIETVARKGYRFIAPIEPNPQSPLPTSSRRRWSIALSGGLAILLASALVTIAWQNKSRAARVDASEQAYSSGIHLLRQRTLPSVRASADEFRRAIDLHPNFAQAWAALAEASAFLQPEDVTACVELAERALQMDPQCAECQATLGFIRFTRQWKWKAGGSLLARAAASLPHDSQAQYWYAQWQIAAGQNAAGLATVDQALRRSPNGLNLLVLKAGGLYFGRAFDDAVAAADKAIALNLAAAWHWRAKSLFMLRRYPEGLRSLWFDMGTWSQLSSDSVSQRAAGATTRYRQGGLAAPFGDLLAMTAGTDAATMQAENRARWFMLLGQHDSAIKSLEVAANARLFDLLYLGVDPIYDPIRWDPRFQAILKTINPEKS